MKEPIFSQFFSSNIWSVHMTQRNSSLAENNDHYGELHVRIWKKKKKKTHHRSDVLSKSLTVIEQLNTMRRVHRIHVPKKKHRETNHRKAKE